MKYSINRENYHRFDILEIGKLPARSYFIPFADRSGADRVTVAEKRYASTKVRCLNGQWDFRFYPKPKELPLILDTDKTDLTPLMCHLAGSFGVMTGLSM